MRCGVAPAECCRLVGSGRYCRAGAAAVPSPARTPVSERRAPNCPARDSRDKHTVPRPVSRRSHLEKLSDPGRQRTGIYFPSAPAGPGARRVGALFQFIPGRFRATPALDLPPSPGVFPLGPDGHGTAPNGAALQSDQRMRTGSGGAVGHVVSEGKAEHAQ
ncbi:unnamed protein product [Coccothraustes coccothraustes]